MKTELRGLVIQSAARVEYLMSLTLSALMEIDIEKSKILGYGSAAFSFHSKLMIMLELKAISAKDEKTLTAFSQIRNKFAHHPECSSLESCYQLLSDKKCLKQYLKGADPTEDNLFTAVRQLTDDVLSIVKRTNKTVVDKALTIRSSVWAKGIVDQLSKPQSYEGFKDEELKIISIFLVKLVKQAQGQTKNELIKLEKNPIEYLQKMNDLPSPS